MARPSKYSDKIHRIIVEELEKGSSIRGACGAACISYSTFYEWKKCIPIFRDEVEIAMNKGINRAENALTKLIDQGNLGAIKFFLNTRPEWHPNHQIRRAYQEIQDKHAELLVVNRFAAEKIIRAVALDEVDKEKQAEVLEIARQAEEGGDSDKLVRKLKQLLGEEQYERYFLGLQLANRMAQMLSLPSSEEAYFTAGDVLDTFNNMGITRTDILRFFNQKDDDDDEDELKVAG